MVSVSHLATGRPALAAQVLGLCIKGCDYNNLRSAAALMVYAFVVFHPISLEVVI